MRKTILLGALLTALLSCQAAPDRPLSALPDKVTAMPYGRLLERARAQATQASEALYVDNWAGVEEAARGLEQTAQYLAKAEDVPAKHRDTLVTASGDLGKQAGALRSAATAKDEKRTLGALTSIQAQVRGMRLGEGM